MPGRAVSPDSGGQHGAGGTTIDIVAAIERALEVSGADACIAVGRRDSTAHVRWANNTVTTSGVVDDASLAIVSIVGRRMASATGRAFSPTDVDELVRRSEAACRQSGEATDYMPLLQDDVEPADWRTPPGDTDIHVFDALVPALGTAFERARRAGLHTAGYADHQASTTWLATSGGVRRRHADRRGRITITASGQRSPESSWQGVAAEDFADLDIGRLYETLLERLAWARRRIELPPGEYEVLLEPSCTADLAVAAYSIMARRRADEGRSPYSRPGGGTRIGERMFGPMTLYSDPREPGVSAIPFHVGVISLDGTSVFDNGLSLGRTEWVRDGVLRALVTPRHWAARVGAPGPVPYVNNLVVAGAGPLLGEMIAHTDRALLVTSFWYTRMVDPRSALVTGLTRDGVFLVERGTVTAAVNDFRWDMSPIAAFARAAEVGRTQAALPRDHPGFLRAKAPPVRIERFAMSSVAGGVTPP